MSADRKLGNHKRVEVRKQPPAKEKHFAIWCLSFRTSLSVGFRCSSFISCQAGVDIIYMYLSVSYLVAHTLLVLAFVPIVRNSCKIKIFHGMAIIIELLFPL